MIWLRLLSPRKWSQIDPRYLPFADLTSADLPLFKLVRLSLFQVSVGLATALLVGTLNRVLIVELGVAAWLVASMVALPVLVAPFRALVGFRSDTHRSAIGWRRVPYIWMGSLLQFGGLAIMPFSLILLSGDTHWPAWIGPASAAFAFLLVGLGMQTVQTAGLALASDLVAKDKRPRMVALMYTMLLVGMLVSALVFSVFLQDFSRLRPLWALPSTWWPCGSKRPVGHRPRAAPMSGPSSGRPGGSSWAHRETFAFWWPCRSAPWPLPCKTSSLSPMGQRCWA
jgi:BCD family chlorophyll transporter-like MFS transporter